MEAEARPKRGMSRLYSPILASFLVSSFLLLLFALYLGLLNSGPQILKGSVNEF